jgi:hypothetical protein
MCGIKSARHTYSARDTVFFEGSSSVVSEVVFGTPKAREMGAMAPLIPLIEVTPVETYLGHGGDVELEVNDGLDDFVGLVLGIARHFLGEIVDILKGETEHSGELGREEWVTIAPLVVCGSGSW